MVACVQASTAPPSAQPLSAPAAGQALTVDLFPGDALDVDHPLLAVYLHHLALPALHARRPPSASRLRAALPGRRLPCRRAVRARLVSSPDHVHLVVLPDRHRPHLRAPHALPQHRLSSAAETPRHARTQERTLYLVRSSEDSGALISFRRSSDGAEK